MSRPSDRWKVFYAFPKWYAHSPDTEDGILVAAFGTLTEAHTWATRQASAPREATT